MKNFLVLFLLFCTFSVNMLYSQSWAPVNENQLRGNFDRSYIPTRYLVFDTDGLAIRNLLGRAPLEASIPVTRAETLILLPSPEGRIDTFRFVEYQMMEDELAVRFPEIRTYRGVHINDPRITVRMQVTALGFSAMVTGAPEGRYFVAPYAKGTTGLYMSYAKRDCTTKTRFQCEVESGGSVKRPERRVSGDCVFRTYRLAVATTGEYSNFHDATSAADEDTVLAAVVIAVNRVNEVYERDVAVRMILIDETTDVFFYDGSSDPYSNGNGGAMLGQNQTTMTNVIGAANYDIGHVFSTGGGGVASLRVPCKNNSKARGVTGQTSPIDDPFYIDYVAHEMGHQYGGNHTQNNSCNRNASTAMEPGSASTIMGYAGICSPNVQNNSDDYFHGISIEEINDYISFSTGDNCDTPIDWSNTSPVVAPLTDYSIPISTPFMLTADVTDSEDDPIRYFWEQWDNETGSMPPSPTNTQGPMFRSLDPAASPTRYFPALEAVINNTAPTWEVLPSVSRAMDFRVTAIDFHDGLAGCSDEDNVTISSVASAGPFLVTEPNSGDDSWTIGTTVEVTWDVANTDVSPVSCADVDILLSCDGGFTFCDTLVLATENDGSAEVVVPDFETESARIMVRGTDHIFYDLSDEDFTIEVVNFAVVAANDIIQICNTTLNSSALYNLSFVSQLDPGTEVSLELLSFPDLIPISLSDDNPDIADDVQLELEKLQLLSTGRYFTLLTGTANSLKDTITLILDIIDTTQQPLTLLPETDAEGVELAPQFGWNKLETSDDYQLQVSLSTDFSSTELDVTISDTLFQTAIELLPNTEYFWRTRGLSVCHVGPWSEIDSFTTRDQVCIVFESTDVPVSIPNNEIGLWTSSLLVDSNLIIEDVNITLNISHTYVGDLRLSLQVNGNEARVLVDRQCGSSNNIVLTFDDESPDEIACPLSDGDTFIPEDSLSAIDGSQAFGEWTLNVFDLALQDGGTINSWSIEVCGIVPDCTSDVVSLGDSGSGTLRDAIECAQSGDTIRLHPQLAGESIILADTLLIDKDLVIIGPESGIVLVEGAPNQRAIRIADGASVWLEKFSVEGDGAVEGTAVVNSGTLVCKDMDIANSNFTNQTALLNNGELTLKGNCTVRD